MISNIFTDPDKQLYKCDLVKPEFKIGRKYKYKEFCCGWHLNEYNVKKQQRKTNDSNTNSANIVAKTDRSTKSTTS